MAKTTLTTTTLTYLKHLLIKVAFSNIYLIGLEDKCIVEQVSVLLSIRCDSCQIMVSTLLLRLLSLLIGRDSCLMLFATSEYGKDGITFIWFPFSNLSR